MILSKVWYNNMEKGLFMSDIDRIIENVNATMEMENMPLTDDNKSMLRSCLEGRVLFEDMLNDLIVKYTREKVM